MKARFAAALFALVGAACAAQHPTAVPIASPAATTASAVATASAAPPLDESFRLQPPADAPAKPFVPPAATYTELRNHIPVVIVPHPSYFVAIRIIAAGGSEDTSNEVEVVNRMLDTMLLGTSGQSLGDLDDAYMSLNMKAPDWNIYSDAAEITLLAPAKKLAKVVDLAAELALHPSFDAHVFERMREQSARIHEPDGSHAASDAQLGLRRALFGNHHYATSIGTPANVRAVTRAKAVALHSKMFDASRLSIVVTGRVDEKATLEALDGAFGALVPKPSRHAPSALPTAPATRARLVVIDSPGAPLAYIEVGAIGPGANAPDFDAAILADDVLANGVSGRLRARLADDLKLTPWVASTLWQAKLGNILGWRSRTAAEHVAPTLVEADRIVRQFAAQGPSDDEVAASRDRRISEFAGAFETADNVATMFAGALVLGRPPSYIEDYAHRVAAVSHDDVKAAAARYLDADRMRTVVVGDWAALKAPLLALGWGPIEIRDAYGKLVRMEGAPGATH